MHNFRNIKCCSITTQEWSHRVLAFISICSVLQGDCSQPHQWLASQVLNIFKKTPRMASGIFLNSLLISLSLDYHMYNYCKKENKMLTVPRVAQLRICGRLIYWWWNRSCLFISGKQRQRKLHVWIVATQTHTHTQSCINISIREYLIVMKGLWPDRKLFREWKKGKILFLSVLFGPWKSSLSA